MYFTDHENYFQRKFQLVLIVRLPGGDQLSSSLALQSLPWFLHASSTRTATNHSLFLPLVNSTQDCYRTLDLIDRLYGGYMITVREFYRCKIIEINFIKGFMFIYLWQLIEESTNTGRTYMRIITITRGFWSIFNVFTILDASNEVSYETTRNHLIETR